METKRRSDTAAGEIHAGMGDFHDKLVSRSQLELVTSDPGRLLAWLVLLSTLVTLLLGHLVYLTLVGLLYVTWAYTHTTATRGQEEEAKQEDGDSWRLDRFFCFIQQLDNETFDLDLTAIPSEDALADNAEYETEAERKTTCSVVSDADSDSSADVDGDTEDAGDDDSELDSDSELEEEFEFLSQDDL